MRTLLVVVAGLALSLTACGDESSAGGNGGTDSSLKGRVFLSTAVTADGKAKGLVPKTRVRIQFTDVGRLLADAGCNSMQGPVSTGNGKLAVTDLAMTGIGCDAPRHAQDEWLSRFLEAGPSWQLETDQLTVTSSTTTLVLQDRAATAPALQGTKWSVESLIQGETASRPIGLERAHLTIGGERVTGTTGCNTFQGPVSRDGDKLTFGELALTRKACTGAADTIEKAVVANLKGEVTYTISGNRLSLRASDGSGLDLLQVK